MLLHDHRHMVAILVFDDPYGLRDPGVRPDKIGQVFILAARKLDLVKFMIEPEYGAEILLRHSDPVLVGDLL